MTKNSKVRGFLGLAIVAAVVGVIAVGASFAQQPAGPPSGGMMMGRGPMGGHGPMGGPFMAISDVPCLGCSLISRRWFNQLLGSLCPPANIPEVLPRKHVSEQTLEDWEQSEEEYFCGSADPSPEGKSQLDSKSEGKSKTSGRGKLRDPKERKRVRRVRPKEDDN